MPPKKTRRGQLRRRQKDSTIVIPPSTDQLIEDDHGQMRIVSANDDAPRQINVDELVAPQAESVEVGPAKTVDELVDTPAGQAPGITGAEPVGGGGPSTKKRQFTIDFKLSVIEEAKKSNNCYIARYIFCNKVLVQKFIRIFSLDLESI